jgi:hypothetical protein
MRQESFSYNLIQLVECRLRDYLWNRTFWKREWESN